MDGVSVLVLDLHVPLLLLIRLAEVGVIEMEFGKGKARAFIFAKTELSVSPDFSAQPASGISSRHVRHPRHRPL
jgi:hypothetical protein